MMKRLISFLLAVVLLVGAIAIGPVQARAASAMEASEAVIEIIKQLEGFQKYPYKDYTQYTVGYGTECPPEDLERLLRDGITEEEALVLLDKHIGIAENAVNRFIDKFSLNLNQGQFDALISFSFNCGSGWLSSSGTFRSAIIEGKTGNDFLYAICLWCRAGDQIQTGLITRRLIEANMYLNGEYTTAVPENYCYTLLSANGGAFSGEGSARRTRVQAYDSSVPVDIAVAPTYEGMEFAGWASTASGGTWISKLDASTGSRTLYAQWKTPGEEDPSEPPVTEPPVTEPPVTEPPVTEPPVTEPPVDENKNVEVKVTADVVNVRAGAGTGYAVVTTVKKGATVTITETATGSGYEWGKYTKGWIALKYTNYKDVTAGGEEKEDKVIATGTVYNAPSRLRIRSQANTSSSIVGYLSNGTKVEIFEYKTAGSIRWARIDKGWISADYVLLDSAEEPDEPTPPETEPPVTEPPVTEPPVTEPPVTEPEEPTEPEKMMGTVYDAPSGLRIRSKAGSSGTTVGLLKNGDRVEILGTTKIGSVTWGKISRGWVSMDYIKLDSSDSQNPPPETEKPDTVIATGKVINAAGGLRIRSKAGTSGSVVGLLYNGDKVEIYEKTTVGSVVWGRISKGWISLDYVKMDGSSDNGSSGNDGGNTVIATGVVVNTSSLRIRSGAGTNYSVVDGLNRGDKVEIYEIKTVGSVKWGRISKGWISLDYVKMDSTGSNESAVYTVKASSLRIRSGAGTNYRTVGYLTNGQKVTVLETKTVSGTLWGKIAQGWVCMDYLD